MNCRPGVPWLLSPPCSGRTAMTTPDDAPVPEHQEGDAADAIRNAEVALAHQNSTTAQVDLQVVTAVLNAHQKTAAGTQALNRLQRDIEGAVATRSDLDTPAGARDFQRYLIGKLRDIRAVVASASLDATSNRILTRHPRTTSVRRPRRCRRRLPGGHPAFPHSAGAACRAVRGGGCR